MHRSPKTFGLLIAVMLVAAACGSSSSAKKASTGSRALPLAQQVITVGALADGYDQEVPGRPDLGKYPLNTSVFDTLVHMNESLQVEPMLAERWELNEATNTYRFFLRKGVKFHDGGDFTADDVKYTFDLITKAYPTNYQNLGPDSVKVVDPYIVDITPMKKNNRLVEQLVHPIWGINHQGTPEAKAVGTGPYRLVEYVKNDRFVVERFDNYWNPARAAKANRITFRFIKDPQTKLLALRSGDLDLIMDVPRDSADQLRATPGLKVVTSKVGAYNALSFNIGGMAPNDLGKDPAIREAVAAAVDRRAVLQKVWADNAEVSTTWIPPAVLGPAASMVQGVAHDPQRSTQLLDGAGWKPGPDGIRMKDGRRLTLVNVIQGPGDSDPRDSVAAAEFIQDELKQVGIEMKIEVPEPATAAARLRNGDFDMLQGVGNQNEANPCFLPDLIFYSKSGSPTAKFRAPGGKTDEAIEACRTARSIDATRVAAAQAIHQLVDVDHVVVPLIGLYRIWAMKDKVAGFVPHPSLTNQRWDGLYLTGS
ncbi:MAG: ABC transporter substrate-binding protein [Acidimicrobiales bacterium]